MEGASRDGKRGQVRKHDQSSGVTNIKPVGRTATTKVHEAAAIVKRTPATLKSQKHFHQSPQDGPIVITNTKQVNKCQVWDCGSSLYDSFELNSFNRQLDSAIKASSRTLSMPHLPERRAPPPVLEHVSMMKTLTKHQSMPKKASKLSKSLKKIFKSIFGSSSNASNGKSSPLLEDTSSEKEKDNFFFYKGSRSARVLTTIPEMQESADIGKITLDTSTPVVRRAASERFTATLVSVSRSSRY